MPRKTEQLSAFRESQLRSHEKDPEQQSCDAVPDAENECATREAAREAAKGEAAHRFLQRDFAELAQRERGALVARWSDIDGEEIKDIAEYFGCTPGSLRTAKSYALDEWPCQDLNAGKPCTQQNHCVHVVAIDVYRDLTHRAATYIIAEVDNEFGPEAKHLFRSLRSPL